MSSDEQEKQESQKTLVAFVAGLLIGGLLVWVFGGSPDQTKMNEEESDSTTQTEQDKTTEDSKTNEVSGADNVSPAEDTVSAEMQTGKGEIEVVDQAAGVSVALDSATFPNDEGWIGVRDYVNGHLAGLLGVVRFSKEQGLVPDTVVLQRATEAGNTYAVVFYTENGDREFSLANDVQVEGVLNTFTAK